MRALPNTDFGRIKQFEQACRLTQQQIILLAQFVGECPTLSNRDRKQLLSNVQWLKRYFEAMERCLISA